MTNISSDIWPERFYCDAKVTSIGSHPALFSVGAVCVLAAEDSAVFLFSERGYD